MKKTLIFITVFIFSSAIFAQQSADSAAVAKTRNRHLEFAAGFASPMGMFASQDTTEKKAGYATPGWYAQVTFDLMGKSHFGISMQYTFQRNVMKDPRNLVFPHGLPAGEDPGAWSNHFLMAGPVFNMNFSKFHLNARVLGGAILSWGLLFDTPNPGDTLAISHDQNMGSGLAYGVSAGIGYQVLPKLGLNLNIGFKGGWPLKNRQYGSQFIGYEIYKDPVTGIETSQPVYSAPITYEIKKVVSTFNISLGLTYSF